MKEYTCMKCGSKDVIPTGSNKPKEFLRNCVEYICDKCGYIFWVIEELKYEDSEKRI